MSTHTAHPLAIIWMLAKRAASNRAALFGAGLAIGAATCLLG